jgi:PAS domain S-box-containing protein
MQMLRRRRPQRAELLSLAFAIVLVSFISLLAYRTWVNFGRNTEQVQTSQQIVDGTNALLSSLKDVETGQRGFLLTGREQYLEPYRQAIREVPKTLKKLTDITAGPRPDQAERLKRLRPLVEAKLDELGETIRVRRSQGADAALAIVLTDRGRAIMDQIRAGCAEIQSAANQRVTQFSAGAQSSANRLGIVSSVGSVSLLVLLFLASATIERGARRREQLIESLNKRDAQIRESRDLLHTTLNSIGDAVISTDTSARITFVNPVSQSLLRQGEADLIGKNLEDNFRIVNEYTRAAVQNPVAKVLREGAIVGMANHTVLICADGREIPIDDSAAPIRGTDGKIKGTVLVFRDISERRRAEQTSRLLASIVESSGDAIVSKDLNGIVTSWNPGAERIFGYTATEMIGKPISTIAAPDRLDEMPAILQQIRNGERVEHYETVRRAKGGTLIDISLTVSPVHDAAGRIVGASKIARDITERKKAEERLRASEREAREAREWLTATLCSIGDAVIATDNAGRVTLLNPVAASLTGWTQDGAIGRPLDEIFVITNEVTGAKVENPVNKVLQEGRIVGLANHTQLTAKDGRVIPIDDSAAPINDAGGITGVVLIFRDITERKKAEQRLRLAVEAAPNAMVMVDREGLIDLVNSHTERVFGYERAELLGKPVEMLVPERYRTGHSTLRSSFFQTPSARPMGAGRDLFGLRKDGSEVPVEIGLNPISTPDGDFVLAGIVDISERKKAEQELAQVRDQLDHEVAGLRALQEFGTRLVRATDMHSLLIEILAAARAVTEADMGNIQFVDSATGALHIQVHQGFSDAFLAPFNQVCENEAASCGTALAQRQRIFIEDIEKSPIFAGTQALEVLRHEGIRAVQSTPIMRRDGVLIGMLSTHFKKRRRFGERDLRLLDLLVRQAADLIEKIRAEEDLRTLNAALLRANEDLNQFAFAASHDLQEPLRMITAYSQLLLKGYRGQLDGEAFTCVGFITEGTTRMRELLADLLAYTQVMGDGHEFAESVDLNLAFQKALQNCKARAEETGAMVTSDSLPSVRGHEPHFIQLFQNLISNGLKYRSERPPHMHVSAVNNDGVWRFAVADNGVGIAPEYHKYIFGVFKRLHGRNIPGTGIGLAICLRVVEKYGGEIWVESEVDKGATFYFTLPTTAGASAA